MLKKKNRRYWVISSLLVLVPVLLFLVIKYAVMYKGRVIDGRTGRPITGVVVVGYWSISIPNVGGGTTKCLDARETVSDDNGEFRIPVSGLRRNLREYAHGDL